MQNDKEKTKKEFKQRLYRYVLRSLNVIEKVASNQITRVLNDQFIRSSTSILANYIEGQAASSKRDFIKYFEISLKSVNESKVWVALLRDKQYIPKSDADYLLAELIELGKIFASSIITLKGKRNI